MMNEKKPSKNVKEIMDKCSSRSLFITGALYTLYITGGIAFLSFPVLVYAIMRMKEPWLPIFVPFIDYDTQKGFIVTSIYHYVVIYTASVGLGYCDALFFNLAFNVSTMAGLQCNQLSMLNEELTNVKLRKSINRIRLVNFFLMNQEMQK